MQQLKFNNKNSMTKQTLAKRKSAIMDELLTKPEVKKIVEKLDVNMNEFDYYLGYFLSYYEDRCACNKCQNIEKCTKEIPGMVLKLIRKEDNSIEREYALCPRKEEQRKMMSNYLIRDFSDDLLKIDIDDVENRKGRFKDEKEILSIDLDEDKKGLFVCGPSSSGKSYPLIALCNEFVKNNKKCAFVDVKNFIASLKSTFDYNKENYNKLMSVVKTVDVLVLDSFGEEKQSEWVRDDVIGTVLEYRNKNNLLTFITSCYSLDEIEKMYNVSKSNYEIGKIKTSKFMDKIKNACPNIINIEK